MGFYAGVAYIALAVQIGWSAIRHRGHGWGVGALFALLLLTLPAWVTAMYWLFLRLH